MFFSPLRSSNFLIKNDLQGATGNVDVSKK